MENDWTYTFSCSACQRYVEIDANKISEFMESSEKYDCERCALSWYERIKDVLEKAES